MVSKRFDIDLDINSSTIKKTSIELVSQDVGVYTFRFFIADGSNACDLTGIDHATLVLKRSNNTVVEQTITISATPTEGVATYLLADTDITVSGLTYGEIRLFGGNSERITTSKFSFLIRDDL